MFDIFKEIENSRSVLLFSSAAPLSKEAKTGIDLYVQTANRNYKNANSHIYLNVLTDLIYDEYDDIIGENVYLILYGIRSDSVDEEKAKSIAFEYTFRLLGLMSAMLEKRVKDGQQ